MWCYVNVCACDDEKATQSFYFTDIDLFFSYATCGATDSYTSSVKNVVPGNEETCGVSGASQLAIMPGILLLAVAMLLR